MSTENPLDPIVTKLIVAMFDAAPGSAVVAELRRVLQAGESVENLARNLAQTDVFHSLYPVDLDAWEFAELFAQRILGTEVGSEQLNYAVEELTALQESGMDRSQVIIVAVQALLGVDRDNPEWGAARQAFENKVAVAQHYSMARGKNADTLEELQWVLSEVTSSGYSRESAIFEIDDLPPLPRPQITGLIDTFVVGENTLFGVQTGANNTAGEIRWTLEGADAELFRLDRGILGMSARDFEVPADSDGDNVYQVTVRMIDAEHNVATKDIAVRIQNVDETSAFAISGLADASVPENTAFSATPTAAGATGAVSWTVEGADARHFSIDPNTGALAMLARDFEAPVDAGNDNVYNLIVRAVDANGLIANQPVAISVTDINERASLSIGGLADFRAFEGSIYAAYANVTGAIGVVTWTVEGNDADLFTLNSSGLLELGPQTLNAPADKGADNTYNVTVRATDADGNTAAQPLAVTIINAPSRPAGKLVISGLSDANMAENRTHSDTATVSGAVGRVTWSLEGEDAARFKISSAGRLTLTDRDFERPVDTGADNTYKVTVRATDERGDFGTQAVVITVTDINELTTLSIGGLVDASVTENTAYSAIATTSGAIDAVTWTVEGDDAALFQISVASGLLRLAATNFEAPADSDRNNVYNVTVRATDAGGNTATRPVTVTITDVVEHATLSIEGLANASVTENSSFSADAIVYGAIGDVRWTLEGSDARLFAIGSSGKLTLAAQNFEAPADSDGNNVYNVTIRATDADGNTATRPVVVTITDVVERAALSIEGLANASVTENRSFSADAIVSGAIGDVRWTLEGSDARLFAIGSSGKLTLATQNFEAPADSDRNNVYNVTVRATDADGNTATRPVNVTITDVVEAATLSIGGLADASVAENRSFSADATVAGAIGAVTWTVEGDDAALFNINASGQLMLSAQNFEAPADQGANNVYNVTVRATDADGNTATRPVAVTITDVVERATLTISDSQASGAATGPVTYTFRFSEPVINFTGDDITVTHGTKGEFVATTTGADAGKLFTLVVTPKANAEGSDIGVSAGREWTDAAGLEPVADTIAPAQSFDTARPTLTITNNQSGSIANGDVNYTFTFSEAVRGFALEDITVTNGTKGAFTAGEGADAGRVYTLVVGPTPGTQGESIGLTVGTDWADLAGNAPAGNSSAPPQAFDTLAPGLTISSDYDTLNGDEEAQVTFTFTFTEAVTGFSKDDIDVVGGSLGELTASGSTTYTAAFTPEANFEGTASVSVAAGRFADAAGNASTAAASHTLGVDTRQPTLGITNDQTPGSTAKGQVTYTFTFSEAVTGFDISDIAVTGGQPLELVPTIAGPGVDRVYSLVVVPPVDTAAGTIEVSAGNGWTDKLGNRPAAATTSAASQPFDTLAPSGSVTSLSVTEDNVINFAESGQDTLAVTGRVAGEYTVGDTVLLVVNSKAYLGAVDDAEGRFSFNGVLRSDLLAIATDGSGAVSASVRLQDEAGNVGFTPAFPQTFAVDTTAPTLSITSSAASLKAGENAIITFTFSEDPGNSLLADSEISVTGGTLSSFGGTGPVRTATFTPTDGFEGPASVSVAPGAFTDAAGNTGATVATPSLAVDNRRPTLTIESDHEGRTATGPVTYTFRFSEAVEGFTAEDIAVEFGSKGAFTPAPEGENADKVFSLVVTPDPDTEGESILLSVGKGWTDKAGNTLSADSISAADQPYDTVAPTGVVIDVKVTDDNIVNIEESTIGTDGTATLTVTGKVTGDFKVGDVVTLVVAGISSTGPVLDDDGRFSIGVRRVDLIDDADRSVTVSVARHDAADNTATTTSEHGYSFNLDKPQVTLDALPGTAVGDRSPVVSGKVTGLPVGAVTVLLTVYDSAGNALGGAAFEGGISVTTNADGTFSRELPDLPASGRYSVVASTTARSEAGNPADSGTVTVTYSPVTISATGGHGFTSTVDENTTGWQLNLSTGGGAEEPTYSLQLVTDPTKSPDLGKFTLAGNTLVYTGSRDYEAFGSAAGDNTYQVTLHADDGKGNTTEQVVRFSLNNLGPAFQISGLLTEPLDEARTVGAVTLTPTDLTAANTYYHLDTESNANAGWTVWGAGGNEPLARFIADNPDPDLEGKLPDNRSAVDLLTFRAVGTGAGLQLAYVLNPAAGAYKALSEGESLSTPITLWVNTTEPGAANGEVTRLQVPVLLRGVNDAPSVVDFTVPGESLAVESASSIGFYDVAYGVDAADWDDSTEDDYTVDIAHFRVTEVVAGTLTVGAASYTPGSALPTGGVLIDRDTMLSWQKSPESGESGHVAAFRVEAVDRQGAVSSTAATVHVDVQAQNATITPDGAQVTSVVEDDESNSLAGGNLQVQDPDVGENVLLPAAPGSLEGRYGNFTFTDSTGRWTYELDQSSNATQALRGGQIEEESLTITSADGTPYTITVNVTGSNDVATITPQGTPDLAVKKGDPANLTAGGTLVVVDRDAGENVFAPVADSALVGMYGNFTFNHTTGGWTYTLDDRFEATQNLAPGVSVLDTLEVKSFDGATLHEIGVSVRSNTLPVSTAPLGVTTNEDTPVAIIGLSVDDADAAATDTFTVILTVTNGMLQVDAAVTGGLGAGGIASFDEGRFVTLTGTFAQVKATLSAANGVVFYPAEHYFSTTENPAILTMTSNDGVGGVTPSGPVAITVNAVNDAPTGTLLLSGTPAKGQVLIADASTIGDADGLGPFSYQWLRDGVAIDGATSSTYTLGDADVDKSISVRVSYTDGNGLSETVVSQTSGKVAFVNTPANGTPTISGTFTEDQTLTAVISGIGDADGLGRFGFVWLRDGAAIDGATSSTYTLGDADVGKAISVRVSFEDGKGTVETMTSAAYGPVANVNDAPTGTLTISGTAAKGRVLSTDTSVIGDADVLGTLGIQWLRDGSAIDGATASSYTLGDADVGKAISVQVTYTDGHGTAETVTSAATAPVAHTNTPATGTVVISGTFTEDQVLTANAGGLADVDGLGTFSYQWLRDGTAIDGATSSTYTLGDADVGKAISVRVSFEDRKGGSESVTSAASSPVANVNDLPTGAPAITYTPAVAGARPNVGQVLTAGTGTTADADDLGTLTYQWLRAGNVIDGATNSTYTLVTADAGSAISVRARYTDGQGTAETLESSATAAVNSLPTTVAGPVTSNAGTEDTVVVVRFADIQTALVATDADGTVAKFTVGSVTSGSLKIGATPESAVVFNSSTDNAITADLNAYWTPASNQNGLRSMFTVRAVDNDGAASSSLAQLQANLTSVNDAPGIGLMLWDDYSKTPYDPTAPAIAGNPVAYLMSGGAQPSDPENNVITRIKIVVTSGLDSANDRLELAATYFDGFVPNLSVADNLDITQYDPDATVNAVGPGELILAAKAGVSISNGTWSELLQFVVMRSQPGAAAGDRVFAIEVTDAPGGSLTPLTAVVTSHDGKPFVVTVAASSAPEPASEDPLVDIGAAGAGTTALLTSGGGIASAVMQGDWGDDPGSFWIDQWDAASSAMADDSACPAVPADTPDPLAYWQLAESFTLLP